MANEETYTLKIKKENVWKYSTFILAAILIVGAIVFFTQDKTGTQTPGTVVANTGTQQLPSQTAQVEIPITDKDPQIGDKDAPVTVVEFSDFSCPYCGAASGDSQQYVDYMKSQSPSWEPAVPGIMDNYVKTGKVRFVFKYFPGHGAGQQAQLVGWCLNEQKSDLFWTFHNKAFANQDSTNDLDKMKALAKDSGADMTKLDKCLAAKTYDAKLDSDSQEGQTAGVQGTPAFYVNGKLISGAQPYSVFQQSIDAELAK